MLALGLAHVILAGKLRPADAGRAGAAIDGWSERSAGLRAGDGRARSPASPRRRSSGSRTAWSSCSRRSRCVGGAPLAQTNGLFTALAVNALNGVLGSVGQPGGIFFTPGNLKSEIRNLKSQDLASAKVLLLDDANPIFDAPKAWKVREALAAIPFIASFGSFIDDTSAHADLILPDHSFLESWVDSAPESGSMEAVTTVAGPVMKPLYQTRATADVLIEARRQAEDAGRAAVEDGGGSGEVGHGGQSTVRSPPSPIRNPQSAIRNAVRRAAV